MTAFSFGQASFRESESQTLKFQHDWIWDGKRESEKSLIGWTACKSQPSSVMLAVTSWNLRKFRNHRMGATALQWSLLFLVQSEDWVFFSSQQQQETLCWSTVSYYETDSDAAEHHDLTSFPICSLQCDLSKLQYQLCFPDCNCNVISVTLTMKTTSKVCYEGHS